MERRLTKRDDWKEKRQMRTVEKGERRKTGG